MAVRQTNNTRINGSRPGNRTAGRTGTHRAANGTGNGSAVGVWTVVIVLLVTLIFSFLSLNLKNVDYGYQMQELRARKKNLNEEIARLKAKKASLLNLERVEDIVINKLGYQYPEPEQFIKVFED